MFRRCFEVTENTNLTLREFWKEHYNIVNCLKIIDMAWQSVTRRTLNSAWWKLWPDCVSKRDFEGFVSETPVVEEIVSLGKSMGLEVDDGDINDLVEEHSEELTTDELLQLQEQQHSDAVEEIGSPEEDIVAEKAISTSDIKAVLAKWQDVSEFVEKNHPEKVSTGRAAALFNDTALAHFRNILKGRKKQTSLDMFLMKRPASVESEESVQ